MNYVLRPPDGKVKGSIDNHSGTQADIWLNLSLYNTVPAGAFYVVMRTPDKKGQVNKYTASSNFPVNIKTRQIGRVKSVKVNFANTLMYNPISNKSVNNCHAFFTATQSRPNTWTGALKIVYPNGRVLTVHGHFQGSVIVNKQVEGKRVSSCVTPGT